MARSSSITSKVTLRDYEDADLEAVILLAQELQAHEIQYHDQFKPVNEVGIDHVENMKTQVAKYKGRFLLAILERKIIAFAVLFLDVISEDEPTFKGYTYAKLDYIVVSQHVRGQGVGKLLLDECQNISCQAGRKFFQLSVLGGNKSARNFYAREGMEEFFVMLEKRL